MNAGCSVLMRKADPLGLAFLYYLHKSTTVYDCNIYREITEFSRNITMEKGTTEEKSIV